MAPSRSSLQDLLALQRGHPGPAQFAPPGLSQGSVWGAHGSSPVIAALIQAGSPAQEAPEHVLRDNYTLKDLP